MFSRTITSGIVCLAVTTFAIPVIAANLESFEGQVLMLSADKHLTIQHQDDQRTFIVNGDTKITVDGENGRWEDLQTGYTVTVQADREGDHFVAKSVAAYANE